MRSGILVALVLIIIVCIILLYPLSNRLSSERYNVPLIPPLNYFTLQEPPYFFYDAVVPQGFDKPGPEESSDIDAIFGPDNYFRYYLPGEV